MTFTWFFVFLPYQFCISPEGVVHPYLKNKGIDKTTEGRDLVSVVECLTSMHEVLGLIPGIIGEGGMRGGGE